jgi:hypothetical protein
MNLADHTLRVATLKAIADFVDTEYKQARAEAEEAYRENGIRGVNITLPDGEVIGGVTVKQPEPTVKVDEDAVIDWVAEHVPTEIEEYLDPAVQLDQEAIEWARANRGDLLRRRVRRVWRDELAKQIKAEGGCVLHPATGETTKVAEVKPVKPSGAFSLSPDPHGERSKRLLNALRDGELSGVTPLVLPAPPNDERAGGAA